MPFFGYFLLTRGLTFNKLPEFVVLNTNFYFDELQVATLTNVT